MSLNDIEWSMLKHSIFEIGNLLPEVGNFLKKKKIANLHTEFTC